MDAVERANSGHPGTPMALAPAAYVLWTRHLKHSPRHPGWPDRDRFVLSCGHASMLQYALLHLTGYDLPLEEIRNFRQWGSRTPGHPERGHTVGVEVTTGPLGQGVANAVGMAIAERLLAARVNQPGHAIVDHRTWAFVSDGDLMEGIASEAASLAGHLSLHKLTLIYDDNQITIDGRTDLAFSERVGHRFEAYGWNILKVTDGNDLEAIDRALTAAAGATKPTLIVLTTVIGDPAPTKRDTSGIHGSPLGAAEIAATKKLLGWPEEPAFFVPDEAYEDLRGCRTRGDGYEAAWQARWRAYGAAHPALAAEFERCLRGDLPVGWEAALPDGAAMGAQETRKASQKVVDALAAVLPELAGGSADLTSNNGVTLRGAGAFSAAAPGRQLYWGIREHAMLAACNGMAAHGGVRPLAATFLVFADYLKPALRLAALMQLPVIFVGTHDSIGVGEDGPTHQPIDQLAMLRAIPNCLVLRPADAEETVEAWRIALQQRTRPTVLVLTRQKVPALDRKTALAGAAATARGAYVLHEPAGPPEAIILATGSEVSVALAGAQLLEKQGVLARVVSMPSWELFAEQPAGYRDAVLPPGVTARVAVEAASPFGWHRWIGEHGRVLGMDSFGASAPGDRLFQEFGFTPDRVAALVRDVLPRSRT